MSNDEKPLHDENGKLTLAGYKTLQASLNSPALHQTVDMNINKFKKHLKTLDLTKGQRTKLLQDYRAKGWSEYKDIVQHRGTFPVHKNVVKNTEGNDSGTTEK